ncbi:BCL2/adenovirus E1B 19 kDa protein-interacting protein 2 isoform X15 [Brienomyrus brachyistius]|uniref:BCL2/adenovirus E1B 19 kDa protein-interacting protein 2 isoform X12 n=1 Tax=Brienomyrus brachyistius TaxID=42636 RepID=UPI0020B3856A|nr:BCL2/adenovirus E1B 19 kDa protein-interacting protein 2 isoform X12 [Brienomyrus brachyistius]XP_048828866.1 BCL2/adenovirus E1B 19 kDa protein-interacting protein 2 isoform X13 [Brienomyrus brachyistius]XP_048828867.1 BCL2/adenovirus E1B 19 kDa protein-interacting protein 2 isoform X14 [Brienomyrus brachyistius]XP_048828868.1 BCL2/adenovirus E1B 19 kDa protein-interacting protein 2 isoform X15 [Brienomyrus brachyistius]
MAAEVIESDSGLRQSMNSSLNKSGSAADTPREPMEQEAGSSARRTAPSPGSMLAAARSPAQEAVAPTGGQTPTPGVRSSTPLTLPVQPASPGHNGSCSLERQESVATTEARLRMEGVELKEEWQDEDFPRPLPEEEDGQLDEELFSSSSVNRQSGTQSYGLSSDKKPKKKLMAPDINLTLDRSEGSVVSDELDESGELDLDAMDTPSDNSNEFEWEDDLPKPKTTDLLRKGVEAVQEYSASEEREEGRRWRIFRIGDQDHKVDMKAIEPYKRVISHGGYYGDGLNAIIVFAVCFMPESNQPNYRYIMDNLFKYVIGTLELLVAENYMIVYLNGATSRRKMPSVGWLRKCYQQIDRRLRKNLKSLIIVHPSWFIRTLLAITKPFISSKFSQKVKYVFSLTDLAELVPMEYLSIPECIKQFDEEKNRKRRKRIDQDLHSKVEMAAAAMPE